MALPPFHVLNTCNGGTNSQIWMHQSGFATSNGTRLALYRHIYCKVTYMCVVYCTYALLWLQTGLNVVEVAHDMQLQVARYITSDLKLLNLYNTWHGKHALFFLCYPIFTCTGCVTISHSWLIDGLGTKNVSMELSKITKGQVRHWGKMWFPQLADKRMTLILCSVIIYMEAIIRKSIKVHLYWAMKNCSECPKTLRNYITSHYQVCVPASFILILCT